MAKQNKEKVSFTLMPENMEWIRSLTEKTGISMSLFIDSILTGVRVSMQEGVSEREAMSMAFEQVAKGLRGKSR